ncbi:hypothetical protein E2C01_054602 [Portunus trituberculatus]|uniref:Uncharacterized protein n=1 Tax=Portunus trituberculatus TaxID=210409 RepID=A0A5B7GSI4_PORTR|nr:hypothetical protein [Portunus trituberculatus]
MNLTTNPTTTTTTITPPCGNEAGWVALCHYRIPRAASFEMIQGRGSGPSLPAARPGQRKQRTVASPYIEDSN